MKERKLYVCDYCNTEYNSKETATECEKNHKKFKTVFAAKYLPITVRSDGTPEHISVEFEGGMKVRYRRG